MNIDQREIGRRLRILRHVHSFTDAQTPWRQLLAARHSPAESSHQALQQTGPPPPGRGLPSSHERGIAWKLGQDHPVLPLAYRSIFQARACQSGSHSP